MRTTLALMLALALAAGCSGADAKKADGALVDQPGACSGAGPMEAAEAWAAAEGGQVERLWRDGNSWRALVVAQGGATLLVLEARNVSWTVGEVKPASADVLWPGM